MRFLLVLTALAMPVVAWLSQRGTFGPDNGTISDRHPTLLIAEGYAFSVWGLIFLLDVVFGAWQARAAREEDATLARIRPTAAAGFALTAAWMPIFSFQLFGLSLLVIWASAACLLHGAIVISRDPRPLRRRVWPWLALSLHGGWLALAAFLNTAHVIVAYELLPRDSMLGWSLVLFAGALGLLLFASERTRGNVALAAVAVWGLVAVHLRQSRSGLPGADVAAWTALLVAAVLVGHTVWKLVQRRRRPSPAAS